MVKLNENERFVLYPSTKDEITPNEALVYVMLRRFANEDLECYPSILGLSKKTNLSRTAIVKCLDSLINKDFISRRKEGKRIVYKFNEIKKFEVFSYEFLDREDLTPTEKGILIILQQYMFKNAGFGDIYYNNTELEELTGLTRPTLIKYFKSLSRKGYLVTGCLPSTRNNEISEVKQFDLSKLGQTIIFKLAEHEEEINKNKELIEENADRISILESKIKELEKELRLRDKLIESNMKLLELNRKKEEEFRKLLQED